MPDYNVAFHGFKDPYKLAGDLAEHTALLLDSAIMEKRKASLVISGGSTPVPFFEALSLQEIDWQKVTITLADERWVPPSNPASNEGLVRQHLLKMRAAEAKFVGLYTGAITAGDGEKLCAHLISKIGQPFDVLVLGMGVDGHTASLFPGATNLQRATDMKSGKVCVPIAPLTAPHERMTLTLPSLIRSKHILLHITGMKKLKVFEKAMGQGAVEEMPIRYFFTRTSSPLKAYWAPDA